MVVRALGILTFASLLAPAQVSPPPDHDLDPTPILLRHRESLAGEATLDALFDLEFRGRFRGPTLDVEYRAYVRGSPFGFRAEYGARDDRQPPVVLISDGRYAWAPAPDGVSISLPQNQAVSAIELAFLLGLRYLAEESLGPPASWRDRPGTLPDFPPPPRDLAAEFGRGRAVETITLRTPADSIWQLAIDAEDGRLHAMRDPFAPTGRFKQFGRFRRFGDLHFPTLWLEHTEVPPQRTVYEIDEVRTGLRLPPDLFAGGPPTIPAGAAVAVSDLMIAPGDVPGSARIVWNGVRIGPRPVAALFDTAADHVLLAPGLAYDLRISPMSRTIARTAAADPVAIDVGWLDGLTAGGLHLPQIPVRIMATPPIVEISPREIGLILGGGEMLAHAPVLDAADGLVLLRGTPVRPLRDLAAEKDGEDGPAVVELPLLRPARESRSPALVVEVGIGEGHVRARIDTGFPALLRLNAKVLPRLGLPEDVAAWRARGAVRYEVFGAGGTAGVDLLVQVDSVRLGPFRFERPWILLAGLHGTPMVPEDDALLGAPALVAFRRAGIDPSRMRLELQSRPEWKRDPDGTHRIPESGTFLGFSLVHPHFEPGAPPTPPRILELYPDTPAERAGLREEDELISIDGEPCAGQPLSSLWPRLWPKPGQRVQLELVRPADQSRLSCTLPGESGR